MNGAASFSPPAISYNTAAPITLSGFGLAAGDSVKVVASGSACNVTAVSGISLGSQSVAGGNLVVASVTASSTSGLFTVCHQLVLGAAFNAVPGTLTVNQATSFTFLSSDISTTTAIVVTGYGLSGSDSVKLIPSGSPCSSTAMPGSVTIGVLSLVGVKLIVPSVTSTAAAQYTVCHKLTGTSAWYAVSGTLTVHGAYSLSPASVAFNTATTVTLSGYGFSASDSVKIVASGSPCTASAVSGISLGAQTLSGGNFEVSAVAASSISGIVTVCHHLATLVNLSFLPGTTCAQSSTIGGSCMCAVDGNTDGNASLGCIVHTQSDVAAQPWLQVNLPSPYVVSNVVLYGRTVWRTRRARG